MPRIQPRPSQLGQSGTRPRLFSDALTALGSIAGYKLGDAADRAASTGLPADELYFYEDALRKGRSVVFANVEEQSDEDVVRAIMVHNGVESIDAARARWDMGLRDASEEEFDSDVR